MRHLQCAANLRQIALAMNAYLDHHGTLPTAMRESKQSTEPTANRRSPESCPRPIKPLCTTRSISRFINRPMWLRFKTRPRRPFRSRSFSARRTRSGLPPRRADELSGEYGVWVGELSILDGTRSARTVCLARVDSAAEITDGLSTTCLVSERLRGDGNPLLWTRIATRGFPTWASFGQRQQYVIQPVDAKEVIVRRWPNDAHVGKPRVAIPRPEERVAVAPQSFRTRQVVDSPSVISAARIHSSKANGPG